MGFKWNGLAHQTPSKISMHYNFQMINILNSEQQIFKYVTIQTGKFEIFDCNFKNDVFFCFVFSWKKLKELTRKK